MNVCMEVFSDVEAAGYILEQTSVNLTCCRPEDPEETCSTERTPKEDDHLCRLLTLETKQQIIKQAAVVLVHRLLMDPQ